MGIIDGNSWSLIMTAGIFFVGSLFAARASNSAKWRENFEALKAERDMLLEQIQELRNSSNPPESQS